MSDHSAPSKVPKRRVRRVRRRRRRTTSGGSSDDASLSETLSETPSYHRADPLAGLPPKGTSPPLLTVAVRGVETTTTACETIWSTLRVFPPKVLYAEEVAGYEDHITATDAQVDALNRGLAAEFCGRFPVETVRYNHSAKKAYRGSGVIRNGRPESAEALREEMRAASKAAIDEELVSRGFVPTVVLVEGGEKLSAINRSRPAVVLYMYM